MISDGLYQNYLNCLLKGRRLVCHQIVQQLLDREILIRNLYTDLFQRSLYRVGELWEHNRITVAREHLVTALTEGLMGRVYPVLFHMEKTSKGKKVIVSCAANEFHQVGGKMVADLFEMNGWDAYFIGANTPVDQLIKHIDEEAPDMVGLSLSVYFNLSNFKTALEAIRTHYPTLDIMVGGQAFKWGGLDLLRGRSGMEYIATLEHLENVLED